jgi:acyl-CoA synthetase (AMP-forming)/AMP-acid ligase II
VFRGYWKQEKATADAFIDHDGKRFFRTGDLGYYDEEGYFFITDRLKRMINCSGYKVWPAEVEAMLYAHPDIQEACVISAKNPHRGETVKAVVVLKPASRGKVEPDAIIAWAREKMAAFKAPRLVEFAEALPKTATGKIFWRKLQEEENENEVLLCSVLSRPGNCANSDRHLGGRAPAPRSRGLHDDRNAGAADKLLGASSPAAAESSCVRPATTAS